MKTMLTLTKRNIKMFFADKGTFFSSLISPAILLVLYATFLRNVFHDSFANNVPAGLLSDKLVDGFVAGQMVASLLAVCCVTVAFSTNFLMVQDKANRSICDINVSPTKSPIVALSYYIASFVAALIVCFIAAALCLIYMAVVGWYMTAVDVVLLLVDVIILVFFGTALSSVVNYFLTTQGQISAVGMIVGAGYGFLCGAYMPMSEFSEGLRNFLTLLPGTYGTAIIRNHAMGGAINEISKELTSKIGETAAAELVTEFRDAFDCNIYFFGAENPVSVPAMYGIVLGTIVVLVGLFIGFNFIKRKDLGIKKPAKAKKEKKNA